VLAGAYVAYVLIDYHRMQRQSVAGGRQSGTETAQAQTETPYTLVSWNIGFGAYESDYSFFMDGGTQSWAWSQRAAEREPRGHRPDARGAGTPISISLQEVDLNCDPHLSHRRKGRDAARRSAGPDSVYAINFDSPFLLYPLTAAARQDPSRASSPRLQLSRSPRRCAGACRSRAASKSSSISTAATTVSRIPVQGRERTLPLQHPSLGLFTTDGTIADEQLELLITDMRGRVAEKGNYVVCARRLQQGSARATAAQYFGVSTAGYTWAQSLRFGALSTAPALSVVKRRSTRTTPCPPAATPDAPLSRGPACADDRRLRGLSRT
jgi:hypothetical protein